MDNVRTYGKPPFGVAVIHGGPGAGGEMAPVARELAPGRGVLEPIQTATSLDGQVEELRRILEMHGDPPVALIGHSWGAWLSFIVAARYPGLVKKLILVGSGPYEERYVAELREARLSRLSKDDRAEFEAIVKALNCPPTEEKDVLLARLGALATKADAYDPVAGEARQSDLVGARGDIFQGVWQDAVQLRRSGELLELGRRVRCPVIAIHGDYDPHPAEGVEKPLASVLGCFRFILLQNCGHQPWAERQARDPFYRVLEEELESR
ncbi:MAG: alpha/beta hydrolase [Anaerolineae bacterium]|jgi:pimeloyl-ACP methyl ester carboxylesterase